MLDRRPRGRLATSDPRISEIRTARQILEAKSCDIKFGVNDNKLRRENEISGHQGCGTAFIFVF